MKQSKACILLVSDKNEQMNLLSDALISIGHTVIMVSSGAEAISCADKKPIDLVIADIGLSDLGRSDFHGAMKKCHPDLPVILITGPAEPTVFRAVESDGRISKPFRIGHIEELIHNLLDTNPDRAAGSVGDAVLIVDDDDAFRTMLIRSLQLSGYEAQGANDGTMAIEMLEKGGIGTVITDINMPYMDGIVLMKKIKQQWPHIPVVLITGYYSDDQNLSGKEYRPDGFLMKPFKIQSIDRLLKSLISKE